ncbi:MAG: hypothetical protein ACTS6P_01925 [Candidatus Hodgkinia cicadicola]
MDINVLSFIKIAIVHRSDCYFRNRFNLYLSFVNCSLGNSSRRTGCNFVLILISDKIFN